MTCYPFLLMRFREGRLSEPHEYFNPLKLLDAFSDEITAYSAMQA